MQTSNPNRIEIVTTRLVGDAYSAEYEIHQALKNVRLDGGREWFELTPEQALQLSIQLNKYPEIDMTKPITIENALARYAAIQKEINAKLDRVIGIDNEYLQAKQAERVATKQAKEQRQIEYQEKMSDDAIYKKAIEYIKLEGRASTSFLQRRLAIGYGRASRLMDRLEEEGLIAGPDGARPRQILINDYATEAAKKMV